MRRAYSTVFRTKAELDAKNPGSGSTPVRHMRHWIHPSLVFHAVDQEVNGERKNVNETLLIIAVFGTVFGVPMGIY